MFFYINKIHWLTNMTRSYKCSHKHISAASLLPEQRLVPRQLLITANSQGTQCKSLSKTKSTDPNSFPGI